MPVRKYLLLNQITGQNMSMYHVFESTEDEYSHHSSTSFSFASQKSISHSQWDPVA